MMMNTDGKRAMSELGKINILISCQIKPIN
jgi:hypothetical protein